MIIISGINTYRLTTAIIIPMTLHLVFICCVSFINHVKYVNLFLFIYFILFHNNYNGTPLGLFHLILRLNHMVKLGYVMANHFNFFTAGGRSANRNPVLSLTPLWLFISFFFFLFFFHGQKEDDELMLMMLLLFYCLKNQDSQITKKQ